MKKLTLDLNELQVQSFRTMPGGDAQRGTVRANSGCAYTDVDCTAYYSTCDANGGTYTCPVTGIRTCGCSDAPETCAAPCEVSDMTDCHRC